MSKFVFYQVIHFDGSRTNHGFLLEEHTITNELEAIWRSHKDDDAMSVAMLGNVECGRLVPVVMEKNQAKPIDSGDPENAVLAIQLQYPAIFSEKAKAVLTEWAGTEACFFYDEHFIITDEGLDLLDDVRWKGNSLEDMEKWLEKQAEMLILPGYNSGN